MGGFEGADHVNGQGVRLDMAESNGHLERLDEDHRRAAQAGLTCIRESIGWRLAEDAGGLIDLTRAVAIAASAKRHGLQVLWTLMHYGLPGDLCLHDDALIPRFARFAAEVARVVGPLGTLPPVFTPVNEISFVAWAAAMPGLLHAPDNTPPGDEAQCRIRGFAVKRRLVRATLAAIEGIRRVAPDARFLHVDPVVHVVAPRDRPEWSDAAAEVAGWQWQAWDMLCGRVEPELGGSAAALDLVGVNHYHSSQWELGSDQRLHWHLRDSRRRPLGDLLAQVWQRYQRPVVVAETSHVGIGRSSWLAEVAGEVERARTDGVPVLGICLYPLVDRADWSEPSRWHRSGLFHVSATSIQEDPPRPSLNSETAESAAHRFSRWPDPVYRKALRQWQAALPHRTITRRPLLMVFSHLRWDGIPHRSRHLMSRLAGRWHVVFVEEPRKEEGAAALDSRCDGPSIEIVVPRLPEDADGFTVSNRPVLQGLLHDWLASSGLTVSVTWVTTPMAWRLASSMHSLVGVYDCSDELAGFLGAPPDLPRLENAALASADLVLFAGSSLAASRHFAAPSRARLIANGVDPAHFRPRRYPESGWDAEEMKAYLPAQRGPRLGYAGVIDERFDLELLKRLAQEKPDWQLIMVGPVMKIDFASLPQCSNIHWLGLVPYRLLPRLMGAWDAGLLPFLLNDATLFANPLKVLEYLAAGLPVVSTAVPDVILLEEYDVRIAVDHAAFVCACEAVLASAVQRGPARRKRSAACGTWDAASDTVHRLLIEGCNRQTKAVARIA